MDKKTSAKPEKVYKKIKSVKATARIEITPDIEAKYADIGHVGFRGDHFYLTFIQIPSPVFIDKTDRPDSIEVKGKFVGQVIFSKKGMEQFVEEIKEVWNYSLDLENEQEK